MLRLHREPLLAIAAHLLEIGIARNDDGVDVMRVGKNVSECMKDRISESQRDENAGLRGAVALGDSVVEAAVGWQSQVREC